MSDYSDLFDEKKPLVWYLRNSDRLSFDEILKTFLDWDPSYA